MYFHILKILTNQFELYPKIVKAECNRKIRARSEFNIAEAHPIFYKYNESRAQSKNLACLFFPLPKRNLYYINTFDSRKQILFFKNDLSLL